MAFSSGGWYRHGAGKRSDRTNEGAAQSLTIKSAWAAPFALASIRRSLAALRQRGSAATMATKDKTTRGEVQAQNTEAELAAETFARDEMRQPARLLSKVQVLARVPLSFPTVWKMMRDGTFPRAREVGGKSMWVESEVEAWIASRPLRKLKGDTPQPGED